MLRVGGENRQDASSYWGEIIGQARSYRHGVTAYCRANGISKRAFYHWFGKLRNQHPEWKDDLKRNSTRAKKNRKTGGAQPEIEVVPKATRRSFSAEEKARILKEVDEAPPGEIGAVLRKEGIYSSHLNKWRREMREAALAPKKRGPQANPLASELKLLEAKYAKMEKRLKQAEQIIELQKKVSELLGVNLEPIDKES